MNLSIVPRLVAVSVLAFAVGAEPRAAEPLIRDLATPYVRPAGVPAASDVTMRTLRFRPVDLGDPHDTFRALDDFHATRLEWTYFNVKEAGPEGRYVPAPGDLEKVARVKASGRIFGGSSGSGNGTLAAPPASGGTARKEYCIVDRKGQPVVLGHARLWAEPPSPGCLNHPEYRRRHLEYLKIFVAAGAATLQRDEPGTQAGFAESGTGCFCRYCMEGFRAHLRRQVSAEELRRLGIEDIGTFHYGAFLDAKGTGTRLGDSPAGGFDWSDPSTVKRLGGALQQHFVAFQKAATAEFFTWIRGELTAFNRGVPVGYSCNNTSFQNWEDAYVSVFDYANSEMMLKSANPGHIYERTQKAMALGKLQVFGTPKTMGQEFDERELVALKQQVIATAYASGALASVPWDLFLQSQDGRARYFGRPEDFAGLYALVRASDRYLDGYGTAGAAGGNIKDDRYRGTFPVTVTEGGKDMCVFLRAKPGEAGAPVVVHLVDWGRAEAGPARLKLATASFFPGRKLAIVLRTPKSYDRDAHQQAEAQAQIMRRPSERLGAGQAAAFAPLVTEQQLSATPEGAFTIVALPSLRPWGILIVSPAP